MGQNTNGTQVISQYRPVCLDVDSIGKSADLPFDFAQGPDLLPKYYRPFGSAQDLSALHTPLFSNHRLRFPSDPGMSFLMKI